MILTENKPSTEPSSFIFLKNMCSFALIITLIIYTYNQFSQFCDSISNPNLNFRQQNLKKSLSDSQNAKIIIRACSSYPINCTYNNNECELYENTNYDTTTCDSANSFHYVLDYQAIVEINPFITEVYLDGLVLDDKYYKSNTNSLRKLFIMNEQTMVVYYSITISERITDDYAYGLAGGEVMDFVDFNAHTSAITTSKTQNITTIILMPVSMDINYKVESYYDFSMIISNIGGFFSFLSGIFVFLFGTNKLAPWGFLQTHVFTCLCTRYQRKLIRKLRTKYEPIPFVSGRTKNVTLEERVQSIENILKEYYLDTDFLNSLLIKDKIDYNIIDDKV
ncbi:hypothetical protein RhiirA5_493748 [Rhizophagus irregularis]|uniref:Uncharacterized protein n=3 Tax=Rhizophagus irregularis TaxID=588596 RepID=A0A2N0QBI4_9GLOM|nr:hypothetical protein GLOIN_2v1880751 [Rhizophagus irregularis DAOM 181602=DAOM 197198]PKC16448.1 hypothetical protein RhiirA5_493748 [Rhizophagus irregularis]POG65179.1 hypothetical protein GLOIN_2v1880751 [Rhizophagus irregularis DAOM 181602=DAOM 197198]UZO08614.1 hypothetical protein OCT59_028867 [Rhizophagus irregularis]CAB4472737.1 unnamed protein product [Rhizophagus irregularis]CAB5197592.1 unnamed protein product [Rhizophagus irregularis]|eukprot:XP_025172045.1 hypothetical protein GLOIN_2v1880751 [Rhizophagus irregularis DAOM 181602=DAOM 197198]